MCVRINELGKTETKRMFSDDSQRKRRSQTHYITRYFQDSIKNLRKKDIKNYDLLISLYTVSKDYKPQSRLKRVH